MCIACNVETRAPYNQEDLKTCTPTKPGIIYTESPNFFFLILSFSNTEKL